MPTGNHQFSDRLFNFIFGSEEHKDWTLSLYNAVNHTNYTDPSVIEFTTIRETLYLGMHNDVSFLISSLLNLYEQQSSYNPNMPVRLLQYAGNMYEQFIVINKKNKYGKTLIKLPVPKLVVFYNGPDERPEEETLSLSDAFPEELRDASDIQVRVRMFNVNMGKNDDLMTTCKPLAEYAWIVDTIRKNEAMLRDTVEREKVLDIAIDRTIDAIPDDFVTRTYLEAHRAEVKGMLLTEYNEAKAMELFREEGREEGRAEGRKEGRAEGRKEGRAEGRAQGMNTFSALIKRLLELGRTEDVARVTSDPAYRDKLIAEFKLA